ncbi:MAG: hypothetical protein ACK5KO_00925 [Arachnia sp.]
MSSGSPSGAAVRARAMMIGGLVVGNAVGLSVLGLALGLAGATAVASAAIGLAAVVVFFSIGQAIEIVACELDPVQGMALALASYGVRVVGLGLILFLVLGDPDIAARLSEGWLVAGLVGGVLGWLGGIVFVAARQRVPVYDVEYQPPASQL